MLKTWRLKNFKSFGDQPDIPLSAINVLAGANSSGKSTIIQSVLLLKQTLQYGSENRSITLNGPLLRLGTYEDVLNHDSESDVIELGFEIEFTREELRQRNATPWLRAIGRYRPPVEAEHFRSVTLRTKWTKQPMGSSLFAYDESSSQTLTPELTSTYLEAHRKIGDQELVSNISFSRIETTAAEIEEPLSSEFRVELDDASKQEVLGNRPSGKIWGGYLSYFLPEWISINFNRSARRAIVTAEVICGLSQRWGEPTVNDILPSAVVELANNWLCSHGLPIVTEGDRPITVSILRDAIRGAQSRTPFANLLNANEMRRSMQASLGGLSKQLESALLTNYPVEYATEIDCPNIQSEMTNLIREYFKHGVRYLGPLRDSPRPVYQLDALESTTDVGYCGEHTAAILDLNGHNDVLYTKPPDEACVGSLDFSRGRASLRDATVEWLTYLGVASNVVTTDAGVFGHRLRVTTHRQGHLHDLTNVGVGVSQVLPIVVMALLAPRGSLLIFEQPELHLHPKVQARLADFFIALALDNKQMILETHSEYLIDRLRLRIAQSSDERLRSLINILFSEKKGSKSQLVPVEVNEYGAISNWPPDFFEQSQRDIQGIIKAASAKRRTKKTS